MGAKAILTRSATVLALVTGLTVFGGTAAVAADDDCLLAPLDPLCQILTPDPEPSVTPTPEPSEEPTPEPTETTPTPTPTPTETTPTPTPTPTETTPPASGGTGGGGSTGGTPPTTAPAPPAAPTAPADSGSAPASGTTTGSGPTSESTTTKSTRSSAPVATQTAPPAVPVAPTGPVLTSIESAAGGRAVEDARESLPTSVQPNTRLLAEPVSSDGALPSPQDSGLLALIMALAAASAACGITALVARGRARARRLD